MIQLFGPLRILRSDETLTVSRDGQVILVDAKPVKRNIQQFQVQCNVQPLSGYDLLLVPEGDRHREHLWLYTNELTQPVAVNDRVSRNGVNYQVQNVETWGNPPNGYIKARMTRVDVGPYKAGS